MRVNHATRFFKEIKRLQDALQLVNIDRAFGRSYIVDGVNILTGWHHEAHEADCIVREDGLWESKPEPYGKQTRKFVFIWREHPNYCCAGQPIYTPADVQIFLEKSETEKVLYTHGEYQLVWGWSQVVMPTRIIWGMKSGRKYYRLIKNDEILFETEIKKHFNDFVRKEIQDG